MSGSSAVSETLEPSQEGSSAVPETGELTDGDGGTLSLRGVLAGLEARGVTISYSGLSELVNTGDIAQQLHVSGGGNRKHFPSDAVDVLAAFLPTFQAAGGKKPQAPEFLRRFLASGSAVSGTTELTTIRSSAVSGTTELVMQAEAQGRAQGLAMNEQVLTAQEAADVLKISVRLLRKTVKPWKRFGNSTAADRWLLSDLLRPL